MRVNVSNPVKEVEFDPRADSEFDDLPELAQAHLTGIIDLVEEHGVHEVGPPKIEKLQGKLFEMRAQVQGKWARAIFCLHKGKVVILKVILKKSNKTPPKDIDTAEARMKDLD